MGIDKTKHRDYHYTGVYRGTVVYDNDPDVRGKVKIFVHGVYPEEYRTKALYLPWAEPAMPLFGGAWTNLSVDSHNNPEIEGSTGNRLNNLVGWCSVPHMGRAPGTGAQVFVFFEHGDINYPVYFAAVQAGEGWFSEHHNQHVFRSDNVTVRIDLDTFNLELGKKTFDGKSTCKFDSYNQMNNYPSICDGTKKQTPTRIDIQVQAKLMVAINLQLSGDVNMHHEGDMYIEQIGNRHLTLIGNRYVYHEGRTYIEHNGDLITRQVGDFNEQNVTVASGKVVNIWGNVYLQVFGDGYREIQGDYELKHGHNYKMTIGGNFESSVTLNYSQQVTKDYTLNITDGECDIDISNNCSVDIGRPGETATGQLQINTTNDIGIATRLGNINLLTKGQFELLNDNGSITANGYRNLGLKGNITLKSKMGNIGLETVGDSRFELNTMVIPWNPVFLNNLQIISMIISDFDPTKILFNSNVLNISSLSQLIQFIMDLPMTAIYDGLPSFFPVKMITQNPNKDPVDEITWSVGKEATLALELKKLLQEKNLDKINDLLGTQYEDPLQLLNLTKEEIERLEDYLKTPEYTRYSSVDDDWRNVTNDAYWKVIGRVVGNIDIHSWSGDIDIHADGRLGNGGNINITANDPIGTLPDYKGGTVNITSHAKKTVYTDPRNLFMDSINILDRTTLLTNGKGDITKVGLLLGAFKILHQKGTAGGCASCLADTILSVVAPLLPIPKIALDLYALNVPLHEFNALIKPNEFFDETKDIKYFDDGEGHQKWITGMFNQGFGHAWDNGMLNDFGTQNHGTINVNADGSLHINTQNNYTLNTNQMFGDSYHFETTVTPNWKYGEVITLIPTYLPSNRDGSNLGNKLTIKESFGKYNFNFTLKKTDNLIGGLLKMSKMKNTLTDADVMSYSLTIGNKSISINESTNDNWKYKLTTYLDPNSRHKDPFRAKVKKPSTSYTNKWTDSNGYKGQTGMTCSQEMTEHILKPITITNSYNEKKGNHYTLAIQEVIVDNKIKGHSINKNVGCKGVTVLELNNFGQEIHLNFNASIIDEEVHKAGMVAQLTYRTQNYNLDLSTTEEIKLNFVGKRSITSDDVTWAVTQLNYTQK